MNNADKIPTIVRMAFRVAPERMAEFEAVYEQKLTPVLKAHGLVAIPPRSHLWKRWEGLLRPTVAGIFCRRFKLKGPAQLGKKREELLKDLAFQQVIQYLVAQFGTDILFGQALLFESTPAGPGKTIPARAGRGHFRTYDGVDGLVNNWVYQIFQDGEGCLWFCTDGGVSRYDGITWANFTTKDGLAHDQTRSIFQDKNGVFWFGTSGGVSRYDGKTWKTLTTKDGLASNRVFSIFQDRNGVFWFGTSGGVSRYDGKTWRTLTTKDGLGGNTVRSIFQDREGVLWFGTNGGVSRYHREGWATFTTKDGLADNTVFSIFQDKKDNLWVGVVGGMSRYSNGIFETIIQQDELADKSVLAIFQDRDGVLWFGIGGLTHDGGVSRYDGSAWMMFTTNDGLASNRVSSMIQDREGHLWFSTIGGGVSRYDGQVFTSFTELDGLGHNWVRSIAQDQEKNLWFGTFGGGVSRYNGQSWTTWTQADGLPSIAVRSVLQDQKGHFWFGVGGAVRYDGQMFMTFGVPDGGPLGGFAMIQDREGYLWVGTLTGGVSRYDGKVWTTLTAKDGLALDDVRVIFEDRDGALWFGTFGGGVSQYKNGTFKTITEQDGLANNTVWSIFQDCDGAMWFGTIGGVSRYDGNVWTTLTTKQGLMHNLVYAVFQDKEGVLWFGTGGGISRYDGSVFQTLTYQDGLVGNQVYAIFQDTENALWFGTTSGVTRYRKPPASPPPVFVDAVTADRRYEGVSELTIPSTVGLTGFEFHGMSLKTRPEAMVYRYRLKGYEEEWHTTRAWRVEYENLPLGDYTFEVVAVDRDLVYSDLPATVQLHVVRDVRDEQIDELERRVQQRTRELQQANTALSDANQKLFQVNVDLESANTEIQTQTERKSAFLASMSHELRTPMNAIKGFTSLVLRREPNLTDRGKENLQKVGQASNHLLTMINDLLDLSKIEAGRMDVNPTHFRVEHLIATCVSTVSPLVKDGVTLSYEIADGVGEAHTDEVRLRQMVINLLSNAIKFTDAGEVKVTAKMDNGKGDDGPQTTDDGKNIETFQRSNAILEIAVSDTGKGIPAEELATIFDEYRQVKGQSESSVQKGTGLGLSITKKFAELLGGKIQVESAVGKGTTFTVRIPAVF